MKVHELDITRAKTKKRAGRGISAGRGKTAGRGTKGQKARTGKKLRAGFEGGQNPLMQRIPKLKGFKSKRAQAQIVYTENLQLVSGKTVDNFTLAENGLIANPYHSVKVISRGNVKKAFNVKVQGASASAVAAIEKAGGSYEFVQVPQREKTSDKKDA
ncbi:50S ribosomal protein L15 [Candidatus Saccharibacteria bacterium]|nr:50S ribosomal protein L15 [Candidatus Saccharibacteria bacterium]